MNRKNMLSLLLAALLLVSATACGESQTETTNTDTTDTTEVAETVDLETLDELDMGGRASVKDDLPEKDFDGANFTILGYDYTRGFMIAEELTGEAFNDAIYNRNTGVAERFQVAMTITCDLDYMETSNTAKNSVLAGEDTYDLLAYHSVQMGSDVTANIYLNFRDVPYINFDNPWWSSSTNELLTYKGRTFLALGSLNLTNISGTNCVFYNMDIAEQYQFEDIFATVNEGRWTLDTLIEQASVAYKDVNGDGVRDENDQYGFVFSRKGDIDGIQAYGKLICELDDNGNLVLDNYYDEKLVSIVEKLYDMQYNQEGIWSQDVWNLGINLFNQGTTLAGWGTLAMSQWGLRDLDINYAIIPTPKWDEEQDRYYVGAGGDAQAVLRTASDLEKVGIVTEALNAESWRNCESAYYENTIKYKSARMEENIAVLDMMMENRIFDFGGIYGGWSTQGGGASFWIHEILNNGSTDIASYYQTKKGNWESHMAKVASVFENYEG